MNFIVIVSDSLRRDHVSCYGNQPEQWASGGRWSVRTPNIDRLAAMGSRFDNYYVGSFPTVLNRHEMLTGLPVFTYSEWAPLPASEITMGEYLAESGYKTMLVADTPHIFRLGFNYARGFGGFDWIRGQENDAHLIDPPDDQMEPPFAVEKMRPTINSLRNHTRSLLAARQEDEYFAPMTFKRAAHWLERNRDNNPFCLVVDTFDPHEPWDPPDWYVEKFYPAMRERITFPAYDRVSNFLSAEELISAHAHYCGEVAMVDRWFGHLLDTAAALNLLDDTAIIFVSDHGYLFGEKDTIGKHITVDGVATPLPLWPDISHIPMVAHIPGLTSPGSVIDGFAQPQDILPTLLDLAGMEAPSDLVGHSLLPLISGQIDQVREVAITSHNIITGVAGRPSRITGEGWSLYVGASVTKTHPRQLSGIFGATGVLLDPWYVAKRDRRVATEIATAEALSPMLFNDRDDPGHQNNVIRGHPEIARRLHGQYVKYLESCGTAERNIAPRRVLQIP